jgi:hypothetical protein
MILKKQTKDNLVKAIYASSNICASTYDTQTKDLVIIFNNGGQYKYPNVSETDYTRFEIADSQGAIFNSHIKKYDFQKFKQVFLLMEKGEHLTPDGLEKIRKIRENVEVC